LFFKRIAVILLALVLAVNVTEAQSRKVRKATAKQEKRERLEQRTYQKTRKKVLKHRYEIQTDKTKELMKETREKSKEYNDTGREGFFKKMFNKKKRHIRKKSKRR
jgi:hypothetical protein